jgi:heptaprenyl diphosphate synthase
MSAFWSPFPRVSEGLGRVRTRLRAQAEALPSDLRGELTPVLLREGKSLRAGLILLSAGPDAGERQAAVDAAAAAIELLHLATLVHDDIVDQAALRRGEPALHRRLGAQKAVLYGDLLFAAAFRSVSRDVGPESSRSLADLVAVMATSEIQQLNDRFRLPLSRRRILRKTMGKTALLFSLSLFVGAREGGRSEETCRILRRAGYSLGMAFQIQDDLLDWTADAGILGKPVLEDLAAGIYTWPAALAWEADSKRTKRELDDVREGRKTPVELRNLWNDRGYWEETAALAARYADRARRDLDQALGASGPERAEWSRFLDTLLNRRF